MVVLAVAFFAHWLWHGRCAASEAMAGFVHVEDLPAALRGWREDAVVWPDVLHGEHRKDYVLALRAQAHVGAGRESIADAEHDLGSERSPR